ncbi:MAG: amidohydrolase [Peptococcaceae bacterium]|nr:amidohydrolase [Peptococcaceae bacterium]
MEENARGIWDAHVHLFPGRLFKAIWRWFEKFGMEMPYGGLGPGRITAHLEGMGVERAFLLVYAHKPDVSAEINRWLSGFCRKNPFYLPFGCVHPHDTDLGRVIGDALDGYGFYGLKIHYLVARMRPDAPEFTPIYRALEKRGKALVAHASIAPIPGPWLGMDIFERVLEEHPGMTVQLAHMGHYELDKVAVLMRKYPNLYLDTAWALGNSSIRIDPGPVRELILEFPGRVLYGSDFPIIMEDPCRTVERILELSLGDEITGAVLRGNAARLIGKLSGADGSV